jgi:hypothetical protein
MDEKKIKNSYIYSCIYIILLLYIIYKNMLFSDSELFIEILKFNFKYTDL